jgi:uncharacterized protein DUF6603
MADTDTLSVIAESLASAVAPVRIALTSPDIFDAFMLRLGWNTSGYIASVQNLGGVASSLLQLVEDGLDTNKAPQAISLLVNFFNAVKGLGSVSGLPATIDAAEFNADFPQQLTDYLIADYLLTQEPVLGAILLAAGVITRTDKPAAGNRPEYQRLDIAWGAVGDLLHDGLATLRNAYGWGTPTFAQQLFIDNIYALGDALGLPVFPRPIGTQLKTILDQGATSTTSLQDTSLRWKILGTSVSTSKIEAGVDFFVLPPTAGALPGIALSPYMKGLEDLTIDITDTLSLIFKAVFDISKGVLVSIRPGQGVIVQTNLLGGATTAGEFSTALQLRGEGGAKVVVLGSSAGSRFEYSALGLTLGVRTDKDGQSFYAEASLKDGALVIAPGQDADGFLTKLLPDSLTADASITVGLDSRLGVYFSGSGGLEIEIPAHISLGPIEIISATVAVKPAGGAIPIELGATLQGNLGPLRAVVEDVGFSIPLTFPGHGGNLGPVNASLAFKPPKGVGLSIDAGVVTGGGYLYIDTDRGEYAGALQLEIADFLSVSAIGLISTRMPGASPDASRGFSLLIVITADFGTGIQLGFGFTLLAVGGLLGLNRTILFQPVLDGLKTGAIQSIMFPQDVIANAPRIISDLRAIFPPQEGVLLIGPMAKLGWGTPNLLSLSMGVIIQIPPGDVAILGILKMALPAEEEAILVLQVNFAGLLEFDKERFYFFATLYDSHILFITLTGDMGVLFAYGDNANFVVSVGGFHPQFNPPPLPFPTPQRIALDLINESYARIHADGYFAITTNTVQFGTHSSYFFGFSALSVEGSSGFDALIQFSPFHFIAEISTQFSVKVFGLGVYGVGIDVTLEGPAKWHVHGTASLSFFFFSVDIGIDFTWGDNPNIVLPPIAVMPILIAEMEKKTNWKAQLPPNAKLLVTLRQLDPSESAMVLHPAGTLQMSQRSIPLDLLLDKVGSQKPSDANEFLLTVSGTVLTKTRNLQEQFSPSQFRDFDDATKLSQPAYVPQDSGVELAGGSNLTSATAITRPVRYDLTVIDAESEPARFKYFPHGRGMFTTFLRANSAAQSKLSAAYRVQTRPYPDAVQVGTETFAVAFQSSNKVAHPAAAAFTSQASAQDYIAKTVAADPSLSGQLHVLPQFEVAA